jgi:hypothetical protein
VIFYLQDFKRIELNRAMPNTNHMIGYLFVYLFKLVFFSYKLKDEKEERK